MNKTQIYYYKLDKSTGVVNKIILNARKTSHNYNPTRITYRFRHQCGNTASLTKEDFDKVSATGIWLVSFNDDTEAVTSRFKEWWKEKTIEATERYEDAMIWYSKCRSVYELINK